MIHLLRSFTAKLWLALLILVILAGVAMGVARLATPMLAEYRVELEQQATELLKRPVHIGALRARWRGLGPELLLQQVTITDPSGTGQDFTLSEVGLDISLRDLLDDGSLLPWRVVLRDAHLHVIREADGSLRVAGFDTGGSTGDTPLVLPRRVQLANGRILWEDRLRQRPTVVLQAVDASLRNDGRRHQLSLDFQPAGQGRVRMLADVTLDDSPAGWQGELYLETRDLDLPPLLQPELPEPYHLSGGLLDLEVWSRWSDGLPADTSGHVQWRDLALLVKGEEERSYRWQELAADFHWVRQADGWSLALENGRWQGPGKAWPAFGVSLEWHADAQGRSLRAGADHLGLDDLSALLALRPAPEIPALHALQELRPGGAVNDLQLRLGLREGEPPQWQALARLADASIQPWQGVPGVDHLDAELRADQDGGRLRLDSRGLLASFPGLFRWPLQARELEGLLHWQRQSDGWRLSSDGLRLDNDHINTLSRLQLDIPDDGPLFLDLQTDFRDGDGSHTAPYLPVSVMPAPLVRWLDRAIVSGRIPSGSALVRGPLNHFPYDETHDGHFEVLFGVENLILDYREEWPRLEEVSAEARFHNDSLDIRVDRGHIYGSEILRADAHIEEFHPVTALEMDGLVVGPVEDQLRLLRESPLRKKFGRVVNAVEGEGEAKLRLAFAVPLLHLGEDMLDGTVTFQGSRLRLPEWALDFTDIRGDLSFDLDGLSAKDIQARTLGQPAKLQVQTDKGGTTHVRADAHFTLGQLESYLGAELPKGLLKGSADWRFDVGIPSPSRAPDTPVSLDVDSNLKGIAVHLPDPLGKTAEQSRPLHLHMAPGEKPLPLNLAYDDTLQGSLHLGSDRKGNTVIDAGHLHLGTAADFKPELQKGQLLIGGRQQRLKLDPWLDWATANGGLLQGSGGPELRVDYRCDELVFGDRSWAGLHLQARTGKDGWQGEVDSEMLKGGFIVPSDLDTRPLQLDLEHLNLHFTLDEDTDNSPPPPPDPALDPRGLPALRATVANLHINDKDFGKLEVSADKLVNGLQLSRFHLQDGVAELDAGGSWLYAESGPYTELQFSLDSPALGEMLTGLGFTQQLERAPAHIVADLWWPGAPIEFSSHRLSGSLELQIKKGSFLDFEPGVGRVLGLINIGALQRRLSLDFRDLFNKGFGFDSIEGSFTLDKGDAFTNDLRIDSPAALVQVSGRTGLGTRDYDQLVAVTPSIQSTLPIAGALAGGPAGAAAALVAQKLFGKQVDKVARVKYTITGSWDDAKVERTEGGGLLGRLLSGGGADDEEQDDTPDNLFEEELPGNTPQDGFPPSE